jgi:hypothetical protein
MDDSINTFDDSTTLALDYGSMASDLKATGDAMDVTSAFAGDRNPFCPNLVVTDTLDSNSWLADPQKVESPLDLFHRVYADLNRSPTSRTSRRLQTATRGFSTAATAAASSVRDILVPPREI